MLAAPLETDEQRLAEAGARLMREKTAFDLTMARIAHDAAAPAVGKSTPSDRRARI
jgi:hypothetical protein